MLLAIGLQESAFEHRRQKNYGPARGFWQFEKDGGTRGVLRHADTQGHAFRVLRHLRYGHLFDTNGRPKTTEIHYTLHDNDVLACVFARLLLFTVPGRLPGRDQPGVGWDQYIEGWRPGKPHRGTWDGNFEHAWRIVAKES